MTITWLGQACFKIQTESTTIVIDPYDAKVGFALPGFSADLVLITHGHFDHANSAAFSDAKHVITEPGDYNLDGVLVRGVQTYHDSVQGQQRGLNTIYKLEIDGVSFLHMGDFGETEVRQETLEAVGFVDILMIPVGGTYTIDGVQAAAITKQINPKIIIPMHYLTPGLSIPLAGPELFLATMGTEGTKLLEKLEVTQESIAQRHQEVVILVHNQE